jgi:rieske iron-sulfur protein
VGRQDETPADFPPCYHRRGVLQAALVLGLGVSCLRDATAQDVDPHHARPQAGDRFVLRAGERQGAVVTPADLPLHGPPLTVYPMDPATSVLRDGSRLNQVLLIHLEPEQLDDVTRTRAVDGIVAYSAICTHTGCDTWLWQGESLTLRCPCHDSVFDPREEARVVSGPAPRRLPALPLKVVEGVLMAAGGFVGRVGFKQD